MLCTWVQRVGFSDFFIALRTLQVNAQHSAVYSDATYYSYALSIFICKTAKKAKQWMWPTFAARLKNFAYTITSSEAWNLIQNENGAEFGINFRSPDECQSFLKNDWQLYSHENKRNGSKCKKYWSEAWIKKKLAVDKGHPIIDLQNSRHLPL